MAAASRGLSRREWLWGAAGLAACKSASTSGALRIVSTSPSMSETVFALGAGADLVGRTSFCDYPPEVSTLPIVGGFSNPSVEAIVSLRPTLVIGERGPAGPALPAALQGLGIETFFPEMRQIKDVRAMIENLGARVGRADGLATVLAGLDGDLHRVRSASQKLRRQAMLLLFDYQPLIVAGKGSFADELVEVAGGQNVVDEAAGQYPKLSPEALILMDPEVIIDGTVGHGKPLELIAQLPGAHQLRAVRNQRVLRLAGSAALRPGPRMGRGSEELARLIHGDLYRG